MSVIWSWTYFYNLHWNNYLYFKGLLYILEEMIMMVLLHMAGLENSECIWKIQRKPEVAVSVSMAERSCDVRWVFLSSSSEGGPIGVFECGSRGQRCLGSVTMWLGRRRDHRWARGVEAKWGRGRGQMFALKWGRGGTYIFWMKQVPVETVIDDALYTNYAVISLTGKSRMSGG